MERLANYQQMVDPTMVWGAIKSNDAVRMDVCTKFLHWEAGAGR